MPQAPTLNFGDKNIKALFLGLARQPQRNAVQLADMTVVSGMQEGDRPKLPLALPLDESSNFLHLHSSDWHG